MIAARPLSVWNSVSRTGCRGDSVDWRGRVLGRNEPAPVVRVPRRAAKHAAESKRGQHNQSIEPSRPTKAAVLQSPIKCIIFDW